MGEAILKGIASGGDHPGIIVSRRNRTELERIRDIYGIVIGTNADAAACDTVFLAVKPQQYEGVIKEIRNAVRENALFIYLAPGISPEQMEAKLDKPGLKIIHLMPNTPCAVAAGVNAYACGKTVGRADEEMFTALVSPCGTPVRVDEGQMNAVVGISGSSPAYYYMMIDAVAKAGVRAGLKRDDAVRMAAQAMLGSAKMVLESGKHPAQLRDDVCSPGGTTIEAVCALDMSGFEGTVMDAVQKCIERSMEISRQIT